MPPSTGFTSTQSARGKRTPLLVGISLGGIVAILIIVLFAIHLWSPPQEPQEPPHSSNGQGHVKIEAAEAVVSFDGKGSDGGNMSPIICKEGDEISVPECGYTKEGHSFLCWKDSSGREYSPGDKLLVTKDAELAATWEKRTYTLKFLGAGADGGSVADYSASYEQDVSLPSCDYYRNGYEFECWSNTSGVTYRVGEKYHVVGDETFAAQWKAEPQAPANSATPSNTTPSNQNVQPTQSSTSLSASTLPHNWAGTYEGYSDFTEDHVIVRSVSINLSDVESSGSVAGECYVGVSESADGATHGSYAVSGSVDWQSCAIRLYGTHWLDQGGLIGMGRFEGTIDPSNWTISGTWYDLEDEANPGAWYMHAN